MPASSTQEVVSAALKALKLIWKPGFEYKKAGVVVFDIVNRDERQLTLFETDSAKKEKQDVLSQVMDNVNVSSGQNVLRVATQRPGHYADGIRREHASRLTPLLHRLGQHNRNTLISAVRNNLLMGDRITD